MRHDKRQKRAKAKRQQNQRERVQRQTELAQFNQQRKATRAKQPTAPRIELEPIRAEVPKLDLTPNTAPAPAVPAEPLAEPESFELDDAELPSSELFESLSMAYQLDSFNVTQIGYLLGGLHWSKVNAALEQAGLLHPKVGCQDRAPTETGREYVAERKPGSLRWCERVIRRIAMETGWHYDARWSLAAFRDAIAERL